MNDVVEYMGREVQPFVEPMSVPQLMSQVQRIQQVMSAVMKEGVHYGKIPGTTKNTLFKQGAETLAATFHIAARYTIEDISGPDEIAYRVKCTGVHRITNIEMGEGMGQASSNEEKYRWRRANTKSEYEATLPERRRIKYGFNSQKRTDYEIQQVRVEPADIANTVLKMACKRAQIAMTLTTLAAGDCFSQDLEDMPEELREAATEPAAREVRQPEARPAAASGSSETSMTETQMKMLRAKMEKANVDEEEIAKMFGAPLEKLPFDMYNKVATFISGESK